MINGNTVLAIIPARAGSKGIINKNLKNFCGLPLIGHSINQAKSSKFIDKVIVSTESTDIRKVAQDLGAEVPFLRPKSLATDSAGNNEVILHAINKLKYDIFILLQPTSPLRTSYDIDNCLNEMMRNKASMIFSIYKVKNFVYGFNIEKSGKLIMNQRIDKISTDRHDHKSYYTVNGALYAAFSEYFKTVKTFLGPKTYTFEMPLERSIDIDEIEDWELANKLFKLN